MKFKVKLGSHREGKKVYLSGEIVDSDRDLVKAFKNKFEQVAEDTKPEEKKDNARTIRRSKVTMPNIQV